MQLTRVERQFISAFDQFLSADPVRLRSDDIDVDLRRLVDDLYASASQVERYHSHRKIVEHLNSDFTRKWNEYCRNWRLLVLRHCERVIRGKIYLNTPSLDECRLRAAKGPEEINPRSMPFHFDHRVHSGASAIRHLRDAIYETMEREELPENYWELDDSEVDDQIAHLNRLQVGLEALDYFESTIGISIGVAFDRWNSLPTILIPHGLGFQEDEKSKSSLYELLQDAIKSYLAGATAASIAMCRAALEVVLREYYLGDQPLSQDDGRLQNMIILATHRYDVLRNDKHRLFKLKDTANKTLHQYSRNQSKELDALMIGFFTDLKHWIDSAPPKKGIE